MIDHLSLPLIKFGPSLYLLPSKPQAFHFIYASVILTLIAISLLSQERVWVVAKYEVIKVS